MSVCEKPVRLLVAVTSPDTAKILMRGQLSWLRTNGFDVTLAAGPGRALEEVAATEGVGTAAVPIRREIAPVDDLVALAKLIKLLRRVRPEISVVSTPKAGLLAGLASFLVRVPARIYLLRGLRLEGAIGARRALLWVLEWTACAVAHEVLAVGPSLSQEAQRARVVPARKIRVLGAGSSNGVRAERFAPTVERMAAGRALRHRLGIGEGEPVIGYVGRLAADKGILDLVDAFGLVRARHRCARLLVVGTYDATDPLPADVRERLEGDPSVVILGWLEDPAIVYQAMDLVVLPTHREGFPNVPLEAAAAGRPVVTTTATGARDSILPGRTGLLTPPGTPGCLAASISALLESPSLRAEMGAAGREWVTQSFQPEDVWRLQAVRFRELLAQRRYRRRFPPHWIRHGKNLAVDTDL